LGVTPSVWSGYKTLQIGSGFVAWSTGVTNARINANTYYNGAYRYVGTGNATQYEQDGYHAWYNAPSGTAGNAITFTQAMTLDASGNLLVAGTSAGLINNNSQQITANGYIVSNHVSGTSSGTAYVYFGYNGSSIGSITQSGTTAVLYNVTSDQRLKTNIVDAPKGNVDAIKVRSFDWVTDGSHQIYGVVAQELLEVAPYAVSQPADPEEMMAVDYSKLVPMLVKEIQDLRKRLATLESK
jgi:hypothetical protein